jgi:hypothetical protein
VVTEAERVVDADPADLEPTRVGDATPLTVGLPLAAETGSIAASLIAALGGLAWLTGLWPFAARNHYYRSPLVRRVFLVAMPRRVDPTRG